MDSTVTNNVYSALTLCHGVYVAEFDQLRGPTVLLDRPKSFDNARLRQIMGSLPRHSNSGHFVPPAMSAAGAAGVAGSVFETQNRLLETADRIARRLLAGSVGDASDFLELNQLDDDGDEKSGEHSATLVLSPDDDDARDKRHSFFSTFLDAVPVSRRAGHNTFVDQQQLLAGSFLNNSSFTAGPAGGSVVTSAGFSHVPSSVAGGGNVSASSKRGGSYASPAHYGGSGHVVPKVYVQNDAGLETCVVCACTFALPDVYARGYRRDVTIFSICPRVGWATIAPRVSGALRIFGSRACDNAMAVFLADLARVVPAVVKVHRVLQLQHRIRRWQDEREKEEAQQQKQQQQQQQNAAAGDGAAASAETAKQPPAEGESATSPSVPSFTPLLPKLERAQLQQEHFKRRRAEEEFHGLVSLAKKMRVDIPTTSSLSASPDEDPASSAVEGPLLDTLDVASLTAERVAGIQATISAAEDKMAAQCRNRGQEALRALADLCPVVWEEEAPTTEQSLLLFPRSEGSASAPAPATAADERSEQLRQYEMNLKRYARPSASQLEPFAVQACGPRHWEAAQVLLARFAPVFLPPLPPVASSASIASTHGSIPSSASVSSITSPLTNQHHANFSFASAASALGSAGDGTSAGGGLSPSSAPAAPSIITFQFQGRMHETRWSLRGYLYMAVPEFGIAAEGSCAASYRMGVGMTTTGKASDGASLVTSLLHTCSDYAIAVTHMRPLLPSVFLRAQEVFPRIVSVSLLQMQQQQQQQQRQQQQQQQQPQPQQSKQARAGGAPLTKAQQQQQDASRRRVQERAVLPFFTDAPGHFYRKYKMAVETSLPQAARECVLPTVALFPSFAGGRY